MSEYQYYEFQAVDRPLSEHEMGELRACSSRATITATRFVNHYADAGGQQVVAAETSRRGRVAGRRSAAETSCGAEGAVTTTALLPV